MLQMTPAIQASLRLAAEWRYDLRHTGICRLSSGMRDGYAFITLELIKPETCQAFAMRCAAKDNSASSFLERT